MSKFMPGIIILLFALIDSNIEDSKNILVGIYLLFPILLIIQGVIINKKRDFYTGIALSSIAILVVPVFYNMGNTIVPVIIYVCLSLLVYSFKKSFYKKLQRDNS